MLMQGTDGCLPDGTHSHENSLKNKIYILPTFLRTVTQKTIWMFASLAKNALYLT